MKEEHKMMETPSHAMPRLDELAGRIRDGARGWREIAGSLCAVEDQCAWNGEALSFAVWIRHLAQSVGMQEGTLARYLQGEKSIRHLAGTYPQICNKSSVKQICKDITLETIEGLMEFESLVPQDRFREVLSDVVEGRLGYKDLKLILEACRPMEPRGVLFGIKVLKANAINGLKDYP